MNSSPRRQRGSQAAGFTQPLTEKYALRSRDAFPQSECRSSVGFGDSINVPPPRRPRPSLGVFYPSVYPIRRSLHFSNFVAFSSSISSAIDTQFPFRCTSPDSPPPRPKPKLDRARERHTSRRQKRRVGTERAREHEKYSQLHDEIRCPTPHGNVHVAYDPKLKIAFDK